MENITISIRRFEELLYKEAAYEMKRQELKHAGFVANVDSVLFGVPIPPQGCEANAEAADDDF